MIPPSRIACLQVMRSLSVMQAPREAVGGSKRPSDLGKHSGALAQRESTCSTSKGSLVQSQHAPPDNSETPASRGFSGLKSTRFSPRKAEHSAYSPEKFWSC